MVARCAPSALGALAAGLDADPSHGHGRRALGGVGPGIQKTMLPQSGGHVRPIPQSHDADQVKRSCESSRTAKVSLTIRALCSGQAQSLCGSLLNLGAVDAAPISVTLS